MAKPLSGEVKTGGHIWTPAETALLITLHNGCKPMQTESALTSAMVRETGVPFTTTQIKSKLNTTGVAAKLVKSAPVERTLIKAPSTPLAITPVEVKVTEFEKPVVIATDDEKLLLIWRKIEGRTVVVDVDESYRIVVKITVDSLSDDEIKDLVQTNCSPGAAIDSIKSVEKGPQVFYMDYPPDAVRDGQYLDLADPTEKFFGIMLQRKMPREQITLLQSQKSLSKEEARRAERMRKITLGLNIQERRDKLELLKRLREELEGPAVDEANKKPRMDGDGPSGVSC